MSKPEVYLNQEAEEDQFSQLRTSYTGENTIYTKTYKTY